MAQHDDALLFLGFWELFCPAHVYLKLLVDSSFKNLFAVLRKAISVFILSVHVACVTLPAKSTRVNCLIFFLLHTKYNIIIYMIQC